MIFSHVLYRLSYLGTSRYSSHLRQPPSHGHVHSEYGCCLDAAPRGYNRRKEGPVTLRFVYNDLDTLHGAVHETAGSQLVAQK